ncbi:MAG: glycoside hydrolase family 172 protein [Streptosporangiaceae bacterium]
MTAALGALSRLTDGRSRAVTPENVTGAKGAAAAATEGVALAAARGLGRGWKVSPYILVPPGTTAELADVAGPGAVQQIWLTPAGCAWRHLILRMYWDGQVQASVECPVGDFFAVGLGGLPWSGPVQISSLPVCVNPGSGLNCFWEMPFRSRCRITIENISPAEARIYYQVNYEQRDIGDDRGYFHAQFRRDNPLHYRHVHTILDGVTGHGHYVGTYLAWGSNSNGWWGEGEVKFYLDGDEEWPTIASTGTEDYFLGSYNFWLAGRYQVFTTPYSGLAQAVVPDGTDPKVTQSRFGMYRWHITDPVRFATDLRVTEQALGWRSDGRYLPIKDDVASVAYWYQTLPTHAFPPLPDTDALEIV